MLVKEVQSSKALSPMWVTLEGIFTPKHPCAWMSSFSAASTSFLVCGTVTGDSAPTSPASSSVSASSMIELSRSSSTLRALRSIGPWQGCFSRSIDFNSRTVAVIGTSRVMTLPCNVSSLTSQDMAPKGFLTWFTGRTWSKNGNVHPGSAGVKQKYAKSRLYSCTCCSCCVHQHTYTHISIYLKTLEIFWNLGNSCLFQTLNRVVIRRYVHVPLTDFNTAFNWCPFKHTTRNQSIMHFSMLSDPVKSSYQSCQPETYMSYVHSWGMIQSHISWIP